MFGGGQDPFLRRAGMKGVIRLFEKIDEVAAVMKQRMTFPIVLILVHLAALFGIENTCVIKQLAFQACRVLVVKPISVVENACFESNSIRIKHGSKGIRRGSTTNLECFNHGKFLKGIKRRNLQLIVRHGRLLLTTELKFKNIEKVSVPPRDLVISDRRHKTHGTMQYVRSATRPCKPKMH